MRVKKKYMRVKFKINNNLSNSLKSKLFHKYRFSPSFYSSGIGSSRNIFIVLKACWLNFSRILVGRLSNIADTLLSSQSLLTLSSESWSSFSSWFLNFYFIQPQQYSTGLNMEVFTGSFRGIAFRLISSSSVVTWCAGCLSKTMTQFSIDHNLFRL